MGWRAGVHASRVSAGKLDSRPASLTVVLRQHDSGIFFFVGPVLLIFAMVFEWIMGNFFPMMVMGLFAVFWGSFGMLQLPTLQLGAPYATADDPTGLSSPGFNAVVGVYLLVWGFALFTFFIFTCKINAVFASIFMLVSIASWVLAGAYFKVSWGDYDAAGKLQKVRQSPDIPSITANVWTWLSWQAGGALLFIVAILGWYMCFIIMAAEMRISLRLPVGDLSHFWPKTDVELAATEQREHKD